MTVSEAHRPHADDAKASLRAELLGQLMAGQFALEAAIAQVSNADPAVRDQLRGQLSMIAGLSQQVSTAQGNGLAALRAEVRNVASSATAAAQDARATGSASSSSAANVATLSQAAREQVSNTMAGMKDFDQYLQFGPGDSEGDYRKREAERRAYIAEQLAKHTPEGDLNASGGTLGQMADAKAHGAGASPDFQQRWNALVENTRKLRESIIRDGGDVSKFDADLSADLRGTMRAKHIPDAQIDALLAAHPDNPLEAMKAFVNERDVETIGKSIVRNERSSGAVVVPAAAPAHADSMSDAMATLKAAGVVTADIAADAPAHGVTAQLVSASAPIRQV